MNKELEQQQNRKVEIFIGRRVVWEGHISGCQNDTAVLERVFETFNSRPPANYKAPGPSAGDLVRLDGKFTYRYESEGWKLVKQNEDRKLVAEAAPYLNAIFKEKDRLAVLLISQRDDSKQFPQQRIATVSEIVSPEFQKWLSQENQSGYNVYLSMNALKPDAQGRTKEHIGEIRTLFVDIDSGGRDKVRAILNATEVPQPAWILNTSPGKYQAIWRIGGISPQQAEEKLRALAQHFGTDPAATDMSRVLRLPGFHNHKYQEPHLVRGWQLSNQTHHAVEFGVKYNPSTRHSQSRTAGSCAIDPAQNTQSHYDIKFAVRAVRRAIAEGQIPDLPGIAKRIDQYRAELHAKGLSKAKQASAGMTYGERTARKAYEFVSEQKLEMGHSL
jgi:hypothetical protein